MTVFDYQNYKLYLRVWIKARPRGGYGEMGRMAKFLNLSSVSASHIFSGERNFSDEQAVELAEYLGLSEIESDYFVLLVQLARAGSAKLENRLARELGKLKIRAQNIKARVPAHKEMDENAKGTFYSNWYFSGIRLLTSIPSFDNIDAISQHFGLPRILVAEALEFLTKHSLCVENDGKLQMGPQRTHTDAKSPLAATHHRNWRLKAAERFENVRADELFFTGPMSLSAETMFEVRKEMADTISRVTKMIEPSKPEILACMNFDLFRVE